MTAVGGPLVSLTLAGRPFSPDEAAEITLQLGGDNNDVLMNGDKTGRLSKTIMPWTADGIAIDNDHEKKDHEFIQDLANRRSFFPVVLGLASGALYQGDGQITGEISGASRSATTTFSLKGTGTLTQQ